MRMQGLGLFLLLPALLVAAPGDMCDNWMVGNIWQVGYDAHLVFTADHEVHGWNVNLYFDLPVDSMDCFQGVAQTTDHINWTVENLQWDADFHIGDEVDIGFQIHFAGTPPDLIHADFDGVEHPVCGSGGQDTTTKRTTTSTTPSPTPGPTSAGPGGDCSDAYTVESVNEGGWHGLLPLTPAQDVAGWQVLLRFDAAVTSVDSPLGDVSGSGQDWIIGSKSFDENLPAGQTFELRFIVSYTGTSPTIISIDFNEASLCGGGPAPTDGPTNPPTGPPTDSPPFPTNHPGKYPYGEVLELSMLFYEAERSGPLPADNRIPYRGDSGMDDAVLGGYHDAGDHVKFGFPMAAMTTILAWGGDSFYEGYEKAGQLEWLDKCIQWSTDYFMAAHTADTEFIGQIGDGGLDHAFWGRPEEMTMNRPAYSITAGSPGSDLAGETAAALAASAIYFTRRGDSAYASQLLSHARSMFQFADEHRGVYTDAIPAQDFYASWSGYEDELLWSAAWLAKATGESSFIEKAEAFYNEFDELQGRPGEFSWDDKTAGAQLIMFELTKEAKYEANVQAFLDFLWGSDYTPKGLIWLESSQWGSLRYAADLAHLTMQAANDGIDVDNSVNFAEAQMNYILGDTGRSYVCGYGTNPPVKPHHRSSSCPDSGPCGWNEGYNNPGPNYQTLYGALVGGPDANDDYVDDRSNFQTNEVATDYNAGFQSTLAGLNKIYGSTESVCQTVEN